jgi:hypothetical protein
LAALTRGEEDEAPVPVERVHHGNLRDFDIIDDDDREHLRRLSLEPGWAVLLKLLDNDIRKSEDAMKVLSMTDPLADPPRLASGWADVAKMKAIRQRMVQLIDEEVKKLEAVAK